MPGSVLESGTKTGNKTGKEPCSPENLVAKCATIGTGARGVEWLKVSDC